MAHDVYICYDDNDKQICDEICHVFDENNISYWIKSKYFSSGDSVEKISSAITDSKCFMLILSKSSKAANFVLTELDIAFSEGVPILVYKIDESKIGSNMEFILQNNDIINSFPNPKKQMNTLVKKTSDIIGKPINKVKIDSKSVKEFEKINPKRTENKIKKYVTIAIPIAIVLVLIYFFVILPTGQNTTDDGVFTMNITDVDVAGTKYTVHGESFNLPSDPSKYFMNIRFFDEEDNMLYEVNSTADEFKSGIICDFDVHADNVTHIGFKLTDIDNNVLSEQNYIIK